MRPGWPVILASLVVLLAGAVAEARGKKRQPVRRSAAARVVAALSQPIETATAFRSCRAAREAGRTPILRGQPGYGYHLDRDRDGIACE